MKNWWHFLIALISDRFIISKNKNNDMNEFDFNIAQKKNVFQIFKNWKRIKTKRNIKKTKLKYEVRK